MRGEGAAPLPAFTAGAHVTLQLPNGLARSYSLINDHEERDRYLLGIARDARSRSGSAYVHERLQVGDQLPVEPPVNNFSFDETAERSVFFAGGIGITPFLSMIRRAQRLKLRWELYCCTRNRALAAFSAELSRLRGEESGLAFHFDDEAGCVFDLASAVAACSPATHLYCCGPTPMLEAFERLCVNRPPETVHREYFSAKPIAGGNESFVVRLARQGQSLAVPADKTILDVMLEAGLDPPFQCREGICGTCEVGVLDGMPEHRDAVLSATEQAANRTMMICCSRSRTPTLTLDF